MSYVTRSRISAIFTFLILSSVLLATVFVPSIVGAVSWRALGPAEPIRRLAVDADGRTVYAAGPSGLWRSSGGLWQLVVRSSPDRWLVAHPTIPGLLAAAMGVLAPLVSTDGGASWSSPPPASWPAGPPSAFAFDPGNPRVWYAGTAYPGSSASGRILRTRDAGATWQVVYEMAQTPFLSAINRLTVSPADPRVIYAGTTIYHGGGLLRSSDGGDTWQPLSMPAEPLFFPAAVAAAPNDPNDVLVVWQVPLGSGVRVYRSRNGGRSWEKVGAGLPSGPTGVIDLLATGGGRYQLGLGLGNAGLYRSDDGGATWALFAGFDGMPGVTALGAAPNGGAIYAATESGVYALESGSAAGPRVTPRFAAYYDSIDGLRLLGSPISSEVGAGIARQFFEKGVLEDHRRVVGQDSDWGYLYGLLVDELQNAEVNRPVGGDRSTVTYATIHRLAAPEWRSDPGLGGQPGIGPRPGGGVFIPYTADLSPAPGHIVPYYFWEYLNQEDLFPAGWLHDVGLPLTGVIDAVVDKGDLKGRRIKLQAFQRAILTYDPLNPAEWQIERANVGTDYLTAYPAAAR